MLSTLKLAARTPSAVLAKTLATTSSGLNFDLSEDYLRLQDTVRSFVKKEVIPKAAEYDRTMEFPWDIIKKAHSVGILNHSVPEEVGGAGLDLVAGTIIMETVGYGCAGVGLAMIATDLGATPLIVAASPEIKKKFLGRLTEEPMLCAYCVTEAGAGSDVAGIQTKAVKKGDEYILNGSKMWITNAGVANWYFVLARTDPDPKTSAGKAFTGFVLDANTPGVTIGKKEINMGLRCLDHRAVHFEDVRIPASQVVGAHGEGFKVAMKTFDRTRPNVAAQAVGIAARCLDEASKYALERKAFGTQIANHQAVSFMLADMVTNMELSRLMTYRCAHEVELGRPQGSFYAAIAKRFAADTAVETASNCIQIFGGAGFNTEYPAEKLYRDAKLYQIGEGTSQIQRMVISRRLLEKIKQNDSYFFA